MKALSVIRTYSLLAAALCSMLLVATSCNQRSFKKVFGQDAVAVPLSSRHFGADDFAIVLQKRFGKVDTFYPRHITKINENLAYAYTANQYQPLWLNEHYKPTEQATELIGDIEDLHWDGLDTDDYRLSAIRELCAQLLTDSCSFRQALEFDTLLSRAYLAGAADLLVGTIKPREVDPLYFQVNDSEWQAPKHLAAAGAHYTSLVSYKSKLTTYRLLRHAYTLYTKLAQDTDLLQAQDALVNVVKPDSAAWAGIETIITKELPFIKLESTDSTPANIALLKAYQYYNKIRITGKLDSVTLSTLCTKPDTVIKKICINLERLKWMRQDFGDLYIMVDIPVMEFFLHRDGSTAMHMRVVVGKPDRATPEFDATMTNILVNPPWGVPPTILKKDVLPGLEKSGKKYLAKKGLKVYDHEGNPVNAAGINAHNYRRYIYKQAPGETNSLGYVKFNLDDPFDVYMHDTPHRTDFGNDNRALSSGCVRLQQPQELAIYILSSIEQQKFDQEKLSAMIKTHKSVYEKMKVKIPVHMMYLTAFEDSTGNNLRFTRDVYDRDDDLMEDMGL